jgi:diadenosine tetraphosphatase ApaH/serine/threonine PP2A family protein phosphatase
MPLRTAILADVHGNLEALEAVLADAAAAGCDRFASLGGIVDFGPDPVACLDRLREVCAWSLRGDAEWKVLEAAAGRASRLNPYAAKRSRRILDEIRGENSGGDLAAKARWDWLAALQPIRREAGSLYVYGSPRDPQFGWLDAYAVDDFEAVLQHEFAAVDFVAYLGHTGVPSVVEQGRHVVRPGASGLVFNRSEGVKTMFTVGSVGQPRDGCPKSCYVIQEADRVEFRRVAYDFERTAAKIRANPGLNPVHADRLRYGR